MKQRKENITQTHAYMAQVHETYELRTHIQTNLELQWRAVGCRSNSQIFYPFTDIKLSSVQK
jgi:hypothetical protein